MVVRAEAVAARVLTHCCVNCGVLRIRQSSLVEIPFIIVFFFCAARLGFSFAHELLCLSRRTKKSCLATFRIAWEMLGRPFWQGAYKWGQDARALHQGRGNFADPAWERRFRLIDNKGFAPA